MEAPRPTIAIRANEKELTPLGALILSFYGCVFMGPVMAGPGNESWHRTLRRVRVLNISSSTRSQLEEKVQASYDQILPGALIRPTSLPTFFCYPHVSGALIPSRRQNASPLLCNVSKKRDASLDYTTLESAILCHLEKQQVMVTAVCSYRTELSGLLSRKPTFSFHYPYRYPAARAVSSSYENTNAVPNCFHYLCNISVRKSRAEED